MKDTNTQSLEAWETNAEFWDNYMGDESNFFHCDMVRPSTEEFLGVQSGEHILDIACGNGNFSERMAAQGATVLAVDYSPKMVGLAQKRRVKYADRVEFRVCDVTCYQQVIDAANGRNFDKAVANMALMDISDIKPLVGALSQLIKKGGRFVFSMHHPCFTAPNKEYLTPQHHMGIAIEGQPIEQSYYHRPLQDIFMLLSQNGFCVENLHEVPFEGESEPIIIIVKAIKL